MAGKIIADQIEGTTTTETVDGVTVTIPNVIDTKYVVNGSAKAWGHFEGSDTVLDDSLNTSSITDVNPGDFYINFSNAMDNEHYAAVAGGNDTAILCSRNSGYTTSSCRFVVRNSAYTAVDRDDTAYVVHGDLA